MSNITLNYQKIQKDLQHSTSKLICVSKTKPSSSIRELYELGQRDFGENKVQELSDKAQELIELKDIRWHFIGHLQTNKINQVLKIPSLVSIHSIDSLKLLEKILEKKPLQKCGLFLQVNTSGESEKGGFESLNELKGAGQKFASSSDFYLQGLMTIGKIRTDNFEDDARACFERLRSLRDQLAGDLQLSMGMSNDYQLALEYGSDWLRVGSSIFGARTS